jgi:hypothetical protein
MKTGFILLFDEPKRSQGIKDLIEEHSPFTETLSSVDWNPTKREIFIFSLDGENFDTICIGERKKRVVTLKYAVMFSEFVKIDPPISIKEIQKNLSKSIQKHFIRVTSGYGERVPAETWNNLLGYIIRKRPEILHRINRLYTLQTENRYIGNDRQVETFKRDATTIALRIAGIENKRAYFSYEGAGKDQELPPFLRGLENGQLREDRMLAHDSKIFSDWISVKVPPQVTARFEYGNKTLTIQNFNREPVENVLGVDLMYYNHFYKSFVLIQYKALDAEAGNKVFRLSDSSYEEEYRKMISLQDRLNLINKGGGQLENYRLHNGVCYFKLCDREVLDLNSTEMIKGMYIPLDYWSQLIKNDATMGKRGGRFVSYDNVGRYLNNSQFIDLVKEGWIGSGVVQSDLLGKIIDEILESKRSLILADLVER